MEVFVARKAEQIQIAIVDRFAPAHGQFVAPAQEARARSMLEAPMTLSRRGDLEQVVVERRPALRSATEEIDVPLAQPGEIARQPLEIGMRMPRHGDFMPYTPGAECRQREITDLDRMIDEFIVIGSAVSSESMHWGAVRRQRRCDAPVLEFGARRRGNFDAARNLLVSVGTQGYAWAVEIRG